MSKRNNKINYFLIWLHLCGDPTAQNKKKKFAICDSFFVICILYLVILSPMQSKVLCVYGYVGVHMEMHACGFREC